MRPERLLLLLLAPLAAHAAPPAFDANGVRLGDAIHEYGSLRFRPELGTGNDADADAMEGTVRLVWRSLVLWMFLVFIVSLAHALG